MAQVFFTQHLRRLVPHEPVEASGATISDILSSIFAQIPALQSYVLDDQGALRKHVCVFVDEERIDFKGSLDHPVGPDSEVYVMQALSGG
ncbi:MAG: MoaD/ThiS family protein [Alphaproteobacteria bacterium]